MVLLGRMTFSFQLRCCCPFSEDLSLLLFHGSGEVMSNDSSFPLFPFVLSIDAHKGIAWSRQGSPLCSIECCFFPLKSVLVADFWYARKELEWVAVAHELM